MKLTHLRAITAVADRGSLRAAARYLGIDQPTITRSIREVERELGVAIFERHPRGVALTEMGQAFVRRAVSIQNELQSAIDEIAQMRGSTSGYVRVTLSSAVQMSLLPRVITPFKKRFPDAYLTINEGSFPVAESDLMSSAIDFYVGPMPEQPTKGELTVEKLFNNTRMVFGRKDHPLIHARSLKDLADASWIRTLLSVDKSAEIAHVFELHGLRPPRIEMTVASTTAIILTVANSDLLAMVPKLWLDFAATRELLAPIAIAERLTAPPICIVSRNRLPLTPAAEALADLFRRAGGYIAHNEGAEH